MEQRHCVAIGVDKCHHLTHGSGWLADLSEGWMRHPDDLAEIPLGDLLLKVLGVEAPSQLLRQHSDPVGRRWTQITAFRPALAMVLRLGNCANLMEPRETVAKMGAV
jgi:hypothetical protein